MRSQYKNGKFSSPSCYGENDPKTLHSPTIKGNWFPLPILINITWKSEADRINGFKYLWLKKVTGFDPKVHCAKCLVGKYASDFGLKMPINTEITLDYPEGSVLYFCGVSTPYVWAKNLHIAGIVVHKSIFQTTAYTGDRLLIQNFERLEFDDRLAAERIPKGIANFGQLGREYVTCRNFQFGASLQSLVELS